MPSRRPTLPATTRRGVPVRNTTSAKGRLKIPAGILVGARRVKTAGLLTAYRLPHYVQRPPFSVL